MAEPLGFLYQSSEKKCHYDIILLDYMIILGSERKMVAVAILQSREP